MDLVNRLARNPMYDGKHSPIEDKSGFTAHQALTTRIKEIRDQIIHKKSFRSLEIKQDEANKRRLLKGSNSKKAINLSFAYNHCAKVTMYIKRFKHVRHLTFNSIDSGSNRPGSSIALPALKTLDIQSLNKLTCFNDVKWVENSSIQQPN